MVMIGQVNVVEQMLFERSGDRHTVQLHWHEGQEEGMDLSS